jgi:hypothetical protein
MRILPSNPIERQAARAILAHAFLRWETQAGLFVAVAALIILPDAWKLVAPIGLLGAALSVGASLNNEALNSEVALQSLETEILPSELTTPSYQELIRQALQNDRKIRQLVSALPEGPVRAQARLRVADVDLWIRSMFSFARSAEDLRRLGAFADDLKTIPEEIRALEWQLGRGGQDTEVLKETVEKKRQTLAALSDVSRSLQRADAELGDAAAAIENMRSQLLRMTTARQLPEDAVKRMSDEVEDRAAAMKIMADSLASALRGYRGAST